LNKHLCQAEVKWNFNFFNQWPHFPSYLHGWV